MTDRIRQLTVTLDRDYRDDDAESLVSAIKHIKGVAIVEQHVVQIDQEIARDIVRSEMERKIHAAIDSVFRKECAR